MVSDVQSLHFFSEIAVNVPNKLFSVYLKNNNNIVLNFEKYQLYWPDAVSHM